MLINIKAVNYIFKEFECNGLYYKINCDGEIFSLQTGNKIKQRLNKDGYLVVTLGKTDKRVSKKVHRFVAMFFVKNPNPKYYIEVNHKDYNRANNNYKNLEWVTHKENILYSSKRKRMHLQTRSNKGENNYNSKLTEKEVLEIRQLFSEGCTKYSIAKKFDIGYTTVSHIINRDNWKHI